MLAVIAKNIEVPNVVSQTIEIEELSDAARTALGTYREDTNGIKRIWNLESRNLTKPQYNDIVSYLLGNLQGETDFWLDEFGGHYETDSIKAFIKIANDDRTPFGRQGWHDDGHSISLKIIEK